MGRRTLFASREEFEFFLALMSDARAGTSIGAIAFCLMPNHWHFLLRPAESADLGRAVGRMKQVHTQRWHRERGTEGTGPLYQSRFKSRLLASAEAELACCRYVERNALSAGLVSRAEDWPWGSLWHRLRGDPRGLLAPTSLPEDWIGIVNAP